MGWESFHSVWDDPVDPPAGEKPKKDKPKKVINWWDEFEDDDKEFENYADDLDGYSYKTAFDDSSPAWYRKNSFKYKRYADYSPSKLFRSAIGFRPTYALSGDNNAKNKAVRALRTLTRNANTIVDAAKKISYTVQFSRGVDTNNGQMDLSGGKSQTVYVSPDALIETKTPEEEDAVIDALTGFTLLRVQISQTVTQEVIATINATAPRALVQTIAPTVYDTAKSKEPAAEIAKNLSANFVDTYMAGALAKSMLTRLCRRAVVTDWGGFAPYFTRHAKQFSALGETLTKADTSLENYAAKIAYNMIADESEIELEPAVSEIVNKHLGAELTHEQILPACEALMADLRAYVAANLAKPAGELEQKLTDGLEGIVKQQQEAGSALAEREKATAEQIKKLADFLDKLHATSDQHEGTFNGIVEACRAAEAEFNEIKYCQKLIDSMAAVAEQYKTAADNKLNTGDMNYAETQVAQTLSHFYEQVNYLAGRGVAAEPIYPKSHSDKEGEEKFRAKQNDLEKFVKDSRSALNARAQELKAELLKRAESSLKELTPWETTVNKLTEEAQNMAKDFINSSVGDGLQKTADALGYGANKLQQIQKEVQNAREWIKKIKNSKTAPSTASRAIRSLQSIFAHNELTNLHAVTENIRGNSRSNATRNFVNAATTGHEEKNAAVGTVAELPAEHWHEQAISEFVAKKQLTKNTFQSIAARSANQDIFNLLQEQFDKAEVSFPRSKDDLKQLNPDTQNQFQNIAESLGLSVGELLDMLKKAMDAEESAKYDTANAKKLGNLIQEDLLQQLGALSAVDDQLFGQPVPNKSKILDFSAITQVNDEASNAVEEEYVAYINDNASEAKPKIRIKPSEKHAYHAVIVKKIIHENRAAIERIKNALCFQGTKRTGEVHGLLSGDLDEGSLHKLRYDCEHIWSQKQIARLPDVAVGILVDQSGSMCGEKIRQAREMCVLLAEAVRKIEGMHLHVYGHTANLGSRADLTMFEHYSSYGPADQADLSQLGSIDAHSNNYDGYAIKEAAKMLSKDPAKRKYLFVLSDGLPHGIGYCGDEARKHVTSVCSFVRNRLKIPTYAFAVGVHRTERQYFEEQYDKNKIVFLSDVRTCLPQIVRFLHSTIQKEKNLVNADVD